MHTTTLDELLAKDTIRERLHDYVRAMDCIDDDLGRSVFHADSTADYGTIYSGSGYGFIDFVHGAHAAMEAHQHHLGSIGIVVQGEHAASEAYVTVTLRIRSADGIVFAQSLASGHNWDASGLEEVFGLHLVEEA
jgi:hypothetical protein